jgi:hypothetical protein
VGKATVVDVVLVVMWEEGVGSFGLRNKLCDAKETWHGQCPAADCKSEWASERKSVKLGDKLLSAFGSGFAMILVHR